MSVGRELPLREAQAHTFKSVSEKEYGHAHIECSCGWRSFTTTHAPAGLGESAMRDALLEHLLRVTIAQTAPKCPECGAPVPVNGLCYECNEARRRTEQPEDSAPSDADIESEAQSLFDGPYQGRARQFWSDGAKWTRSRMKQANHTAPCEYMSCHRPYPHSHETEADIALSEEELPLGTRVTFEAYDEYGWQTYSAIVVGYSDGKNQVCEINRGHYAKNVRRAQDVGTDLTQDWALLERCKEATRKGSGDFTRLIALADNLLHREEARRREQQEK